MYLKNVRRISEYINTFPSAAYYENDVPWGISGDIAIPCATQNEIDINATEIMVRQKINL